jgi:hypothetical protein
MTFAASSSLHVGIPKRRNSLSNHRRTVLKALTVGLAAVVIGATSIAAVMIGAGWILAVSFKARSDIRSAAALASPSSPPVRAVLAAGEMPMLSPVVADFWPPESVRAAEAPARTPAGLIAAVTPRLFGKGDDRSAGARAKPNADEDYTGSIGTESPKLASLGLASVDPAAIPSTRRDARPLTLSPARPRLAALTPAGELGITPEEHARALRTAIYDITARVVYLPSGERLEAHSGLGDLMDDPRHVRRKNRGATPPNTYKLTLRESLFHGVRAIRLTPESEGDMFGRDGMLAHSYMLGPNGQSNGCVSFKDYPKFLRAYLRGEIDRMVVVSRLTQPPRFFARSKGQGANPTL